MDSLNIASLPTDVLLVVLRFLRVQDIFAIRQTCKPLEDLTRTRSVWHDALHIHVLRPGFPVPGLCARDLADLSALDLELLTLRALALHRNWTAPCPRTTRAAELIPPGLPASARPRNLAVHYLPGHANRYILTVTFYDEPAAPRKYIVHCWDVGGNQGNEELKPRVVATLRCTNLTGATVNTNPTHPGILAITHCGQSDLVTTRIFSIDFRTGDPGSAFVPLQEFASFRFPIALEGSTFIASSPDNVTRLVDIEAGSVRYALRGPPEHDDPTLRNEEQRCMGVVLLSHYVLTFCRQWIHLYALPPLEPGSLAAEPQHALDPAASHKWQWRIDSLVVAPRLIPSAADLVRGPRTDAGRSRSRCSGGRMSRGRGQTSADFPPIDVLIRFDTWFPWPVNILHHYVLAPNPLVRTPCPRSPSPAPSTRAASHQHGHAQGLPYLHAAPTKAHLIPSPIRLFTPSDMVLGPRGTALWLDAQACEAGPAQAGDHGQRVAGKVLVPALSPSLLPPSAHSAATSADASTADATTPDAATAAADATGSLCSAGEASGGGDEDARDGVGAGRGSLSGWYDVSDSESECEGGGEDARTMVFRVQDDDDGWNRLALDEEEGRIALGTVCGRVHLFEYAPQVRVRARGGRCLDAG